MYVVLFYVSVDVLAEYSAKIVDYDSSFLEQGSDDAVITVNRLVFVIYVLIPYGSSGCEYDSLITLCRISAIRSMFSTYSRSEANGPSPKRSHVSQSPLFQ